jgi:hypothetical protein
MIHNKMGHFPQTCHLPLPKRVNHNNCKRPYNAISDLYVVSFLLSVLEEQEYLFPVYRSLLVSPTFRHQSLNHRLDLCLRKWRLHFLVYGLQHLPELCLVQLVVEVQFESGENFIDVFP